VIDVDPVADLDPALADALVFTLLARDFATSAAKRLPYEAFDGAGRKLT
jgi:hypothetical protein